jgi:hypothetical protein
VNNVEEEASEVALAAEVAGVVEVAAEVVAVEAKKVTRNGFP